VGTRHAARIQQESCSGEQRETKKSCKSFRYHTHGARKQGRRKKASAEITVHPQVAVKSQEDIERARPITASAHANCFVSNSVTSSVKVLPGFRVMD
jgi:organic hydroperoxide reductase OsmC/OhrA